MLHRIRIVLVKPRGPANLGAVCRAMANLGLSDLVLVAPQCDRGDSLAKAFASHAGHLLSSARAVDEIPPALAGCVTTFAASSKTGFYQRQAAVGPEAAARSALDFATSGPVAFVFGPEDRGLRRRDLLSFDRVVTIPTEPSYPVLNLAASVTVICYALRAAWLEREAGEPQPPRRDLATDERKRVLFSKLFDALDRVGFFFGPNPDHLKFALRHLFGRLDLTINEVDILVGMAQQVRWYVDHHPRRIDPSQAPTPEQP